MTTATAPAELAGVVETALERWDVPGVSVGVLRDGQIEVFPFGLANTETATPVREDTIFQAGSISKVFTTTLIMQLVDEGKIDLDTPLRAYLPELRLADMQALAQITLRMVLAHVGGFFGDNFGETGQGDDALRTFVASFGSLAQITRPGELFSYCNTGFAIAGAIVERLRGDLFENVMQARVFDPLAMTRTFLDPHGAMVYPLAIGHNTLPGKEREIARKYRLPRASNPAGGVLCTAGDLLRFAQAHLNDGELDGVRILSAESARLMREPQYPAGCFAEHYGVGWMLRTIGGARVAGHGGSTNGFRAQLSIVPERGVAVALLTNGNHGNAVNHKVETFALERFAGLRPAEQPRVALSEQQLARVVGRYERPHNEIDVSVSDCGIVISQQSENPFTGERIVSPPVRAEALAPDVFLVVEGDGAGETVEFIAAADGAVRFMRAHGRLTDRV
jgi:CubicO group peptidase (beta-lactamase class C family)